MYRGPLQPSVVLGKFFNFDELIRRDVREILPRIAGGPPDFQIQNLGRLAQRNVKFHRIRAERSAAADGFINRSLGLTLILHRDFNARADRGPIRFYSDETDVDLIVAAPRILEQPHGMRIRRNRAADLRKNVLIAVAG